MYILKGRGLHLFAGGQLKIGYLSTQEPRAEMNISRDNLFYHMS